MKWLLLTILILVVLPVSLVADSIVDIIKDIDNLSVNAGQIAEVSNFHFKRDVADFHLESGKVYVLNKVNEQTVALVFSGKGNVCINPTTPICRERFVSEFETEKFEKDFDFLFLVFTDSTMTEFKDNMEFHLGLSNKKLSKDISKLHKSFLCDMDEGYSADFIYKFIDNNSKGYFFAQVGKKATDQTTMFFTVDPDKVEEISVEVIIQESNPIPILSPILDPNVSLSARKLICSFHCLEDYDSGLDLTRENKDVINVNNYIIVAEITKRMDFRAVCKLQFKGLKNTGKWLPLIIYNKLDISSITDDEGNQLNFHKDDDSYSIMVELKNNVTVDKNYSINIEYDGELISRGGSLAQIQSFDLWYPQYLTNKLNYFDITYHYPSRYKLVSVGRKVFDEKKNKVVTARWITDYPVNYAPFNLGKFKDELFIHKDIPALSLHINSNMKKTKADVVNSLSFYQKIYGKCLYDTLTVAEIPRILSGEAYPGLINFYSDDFLNNPLYKVHYGTNVTESDFAQLKAHEVSHQWWGCGVQMRDSHDRWLYEGLAEFSSIWYIQTSMNDTRQYFDFLERWKFSIMYDYKLNKNETRTQVPPWMANIAPEVIIYSKGAWILHMLRNMMMDIKTFDETPFKTMMQDFYNTYKSTSATTEDFQKCVEKHINMNMDWFFEQWVYGNQIPKLTYDYQIVQKEDGAYYAICKILQEEVSEDFKIYIPIEIDFGNNQTARLRTPVEGAVTEFEIPLPQKAESIKFNIFDSVLCQ